MLKAFFLTVLLWSTVSSSSALTLEERTLRGLGDSLLQQHCLVDCDFAGPGQIFFLPIYCYILFPNLVTQCKPIRTTTSSTYRPPPPTTSSSTTSTSTTSTTWGPPPAPCLDDPDCMKNRSPPSMSNNFLPRSGADIFYDDDSINDRDQLLQRLILKNTEDVAVKILDDNSMEIVDKEQLQGVLKNLSK